MRHTTRTAVAAFVAPFVTAVATATLGLHVAHAGTAPDRIAWGRCAAGQDDGPGRELDALGARCGTVTVPLDHAAPDGPTVTVAVARRPATDPNTCKDPCVEDPSVCGCKAGEPNCWPDPSPCDADGTCKAGEGLTAQHPPADFGCADEDPAR